MLFKEKNPKKEPGYSEELYAGIKRCLNKHIQLPCKVDFIDTLIRRAEPELVGNGNRQRERHAKTLEIAQEEVLTCIGMCIFERFRKIYNARKEEEGACQLLAVLALHGMYRSFDLAVEEKRGISNLELLYEEISQQEQRQEQRKEQKRLKKRQKKMEKRSLCTNCKHSHKKEVDVEEEEDEPSIHEDEEEEEDFDDNDFVEEMIKVASKSRNNKNNYLHPSSQQTKAPNHNNHNVKKTGTNSTKQAQPTIQSGKKANPRGTTTNKDPISYPLKQNNNKVVSSPTVVVNQIRQKQQSTLDPEMNVLCHTCKVGGDNDNDLENEILKRKMRSQPISVDCGYVSDQLSLTNCSSTSSSSLEEQMEGKRSALVNNVDLEEEEEEIVLPCGGGKSSGSSVAPCSSPLTINSQLSSLSSSPEGSEVACQEGLCNHQAIEIAVSDPPVQQQRPVNNNNSSYIPEELINEFRSKHSNLKASREELRKNLRQSFAQFCLKNKNRSLSHLCRTGRCLDNAGDEGMCSGQCE